jgi:hypothetical protein
MRCIKINIRPSSQRYNIFYSINRKGSKLDKQKIKKITRKFNDLIERNKDHRAYSDFKEGVNEGLEVAKDTFEENIMRFTSLESDEERETKAEELQNKFNLLIDSVVVKEKPRYSKDQLDGIHEGLEKSKKLFMECLEECF